MAYQKATACCARPWASLVGVLSDIALILSPREVYSKNTSDLPLWFATCWRDWQAILIRNLGLIRNLYPNDIFAGAWLTTSCFSLNVISTLHDQSETAQCDITWMKFCQEWLRITEVLRNSKVTSELCSSSYQQEPVNGMCPVNIKCITGKKTKLGTNALQNHASCLFICSF